MTVTAKNLVPSKYLEAAATAQITAGAAVRFIIDQVTATNVAATPATVTVELPPVSGAAGISNRITSARAIGPGQVYTFPELANHVIEPGGVLSANASLANTIVFRISGREVLV